MALFEKRDFSEEKAEHLRFLTAKLSHPTDGRLNKKEP